MKDIWISPPKNDGRGVSFLRVALCQIYTEEWKVEENLRRTLGALEKAAAQGAELAIMPECVLDGYPKTKAPNHAKRLLEIAERLNGPHLNQIRAKCRQLKLDAVIGFVERGEGKRLYNAAALVSREGRIIDVYHKVHCRPFESIRQDGRFTPGNRFAVHDLRHGKRKFKLGIMICFDREIPESNRCLRSLGAEIIACPLAWYTDRMDQAVNKATAEMVTRCRAAENEVFIVVVTHAGRFNGGSFVVGPDGKCLHQMGNRAGVHVLKVPVGIVPGKFHSNPLGWLGWGYRRQEIYNRYLK